MKFHESKEMNDKCFTFYNEMKIDGRINMLRQTSEFDYFTPEEQSHTICIWVNDGHGMYYSPGNIKIDDSYLISNGGEDVLKMFVKSFNNEGRRVFEYVFSKAQTEEEEKFGTFLKLVRYTLELQDYPRSMKIQLDPNVINIVDERIGY